MLASLDIACAIALAAALCFALGGHAVANAAGRLLVSKRVEREQGLPIVGKTPMLAVYRVLMPVGRALVSVRVSADAVTASSIVFAAAAAIAFGLGHFGIGAALGSVAALADALDGIVARESGTSSRFGQALDTLVDRYVDALLLGGVAVYVRHDAFLLVVVLAAIVGAFMVSYASSLERELGHAGDGGPIPMRRAHRLAYVLTGAVLGPVTGSGAPILVAAAAIALLGNFSAVSRILQVARSAPPAPDSAPTEVEGAAALSEGARR